MKILFLAAEPCFIVRGRSISLYNTLLALAQAGHKVDLLCLPGGNMRTAIPNVRVYYLHCRPFADDLRFGVLFMMFLKGFFLCADRKYDVIHALEETGWIGSILKQIFRTKLFFDLGARLLYSHNRQRQAVNPGWIWRTRIRMDSATLHHADMIRTVSAKLEDMLKTDPRIKQTVCIQDAPATTSFQADEEGAHLLREEFSLGAHPVVVYTGGFSEDHGIDLLVRAAHAVHQTLPDVRFLLVGGRPDEILHTQYLVDSFDLHDICLLAGERSVEEMSACMSLASVLVSPRIRGDRAVFKLLSYMQSCKPIVATRIPGHLHLLDESCATLVVAQADTLAQGILNALREPLTSKVLGKEALARVAEQYSLASFNHKMRQAYKQLTSGSAA